MINPAARILLLIFLAVLLPGLQGLSLVLATLLLTFAASLRAASDFVRFLRRARWLVVSMLLIYAWFTPGEFLAGVPDAVAPTLEGLREGGAQVLRLTAILAAISLLLAVTSRAQLIAGLRHLFLPLKLFGFSTDRFAVRLWLTLHYVEHWPPGLLRQLRGQTSLQLAMPALKAGPERIELLQVRWQTLDLLVVVSLPMLWWGLR